MEAKTYLNRAFELQQLIEQKENLLNAYISNAEKITPSYAQDVVQTSLNPDGRIPTAVEKIIRVEEKLRVLSEEYDEVRNEISNMISNVDDGIIEDVLRLRYLDFMKWKDIAKALSMSERTIYRLHAGGIFIIDKILMQNI